MDLQSQLLVYFDRRQILVKMKEQCENFAMTLSSETMYKFPPLRFHLEVDVMDLLDVFPDLGKTLLMEPLKWKKYCDAVLFACFKSIECELADSIYSSQVGVILRLRNVPQSSLKLNPRDYKSLVCFKGRLIDVSKPTPYVYHTVWSCPEECDGNEIILRCIPKTPPKCYVCRSSLYENSGLRRCGEQVTVTLKLRNGVLPKSFKLHDDFISNINIGSLYVLNVVIMKKVTEVWSMELVVPLPAPVSIVAAKDIRELYEACDGLPWKFIYCLASTIAFNICPLNCFIHLKINLLLSLTSVKANSYNNSHIIHLLVAGFDTGTVGAIMNEGARLADTSLILGTSNTAVPTALIACSGGVCIMPLPLHAYNRTTLSAILSSIESDEVVTETSKTNLRTAVWAQGKDFNKIIVLNVANVFGTVCRGDYGQYEDELAEYVLEQSIEPRKINSEEIQAMKDVAHYIDIVAGIPVKISDEAKKLLRIYFLAARKERPRVVSVNSMKSLVTTCITSARLCRRQVADVEDATFAIWLHVSGCSEPRFAPDEYLQTPADIKELHKVFKGFKDWLLEFTSTYGY